MDKEYYNKNVITDLDHVSDFLDLIEEPLILVTSDGKRSVPSSYNDDVVKKYFLLLKLKNGIHKIMKNPLFTQSLIFTLLV